MSIERISATNNGSSYTRSTIDNSEEIKSLNNQRGLLRQELSEIRNDKTLSEDEKKSKSQVITAQMNAIKTKIQLLSKSKEDNHQNKLDNQEKLKSLNKEKLKLHSEIAEINTSSSTEILEKKAEMQNIITEIYTITSEIQMLTAEDIRSIQENTTHIDMNQSNKEIGFFVDVQEKDKQKLDLLGDVSIDIII